MHDHFPFRLRKSFYFQQLYYFLLFSFRFHEGFPGGSDDKASACNAGDPGLIPGLGRSPGEGNGNPLQYSCLENSMDGGAWQDLVHGVFQPRVLEWVCHFLLQRIFPTQGSNLGLLHCRQTLYHLSHQGRCYSMTHLKLLFSISFPYIFFIQLLFIYFLR